jgi:Abhydrolase family
MKTGVRLLTAALMIATLSACAQLPSRPDPNEIPLPPIHTSMRPMPGPDALPIRTALPEPLFLNNGQSVRTEKQWLKRREEIRTTLEYYAVGQAPPPPGNVTGHVVSEQKLDDGKVNYRLVHLNFGPQESLSLDIGIFTPIGIPPAPAIISPSGTPPGATPLPRLAQGANQGKSQDALLVTGPVVSPPAPAGTQSPLYAARVAGDPFRQRSAEEIAATNPALAHGYAFVTFNYNDTGEDTTLRLADGSWAYRTTRFFPAYPNYDWGLLRAWAWGVSRIVDYLQTDPSVDKTRLIVTGVSRTGKSALVAGAFDDRIAMTAPVASSGGGTPAFRFSGEGRGGKEGLTEMVRKYPNWFGPRLHEFWGQQDKLPFDEHWFLALCAPRPVISLEGTHDQNVNINGVYQSVLAARPVFSFLHADGKLGVSFADRPHGMVQGDWDALLDFADKYLLGKPVDRDFYTFPPELLKPAAPKSAGLAERTN